MENNISMQTNPIIAKSNQTNQNKFSFRFAHLADSHIGGWRDQKMKDLGLLAFKKIIDECIKRDVDFVLISGDLFNTAIPGIDLLKEVTRHLKRLKDDGIRVYIIPGSHDFSTSGKTMIDVLESAGLFKNVVRGKMVDDKLLLQPIIDKTGVEITGLLGRRASLEASIYENLDRSIEIREKRTRDAGRGADSERNSYVDSCADSCADVRFRIFMFHSAIEEYKPKHLVNMDALSLSLLPKGFDYYAGGHVHVISVNDEKEYGQIVFPGPTYPNNFQELEMSDKCGFFIFDSDSTSKLEFVPIDTAPTLCFKIDCSHLVPEEINNRLLSLSKTNNKIKGSVVTIRLHGTIDGKVSDIDFRGLFDTLYDFGAYFVMKNTSKLTSKEYESLAIKEETIDEIEEKIISEGVGKIKKPFILSEKEVATKLLRIFSEPKTDGENKQDYISRLKENADALFDG